MAAITRRTVNMQNDSKGTMTTTIQMTTEDSGSPISKTKLGAVDHVVELDGSNQPPTLHVYCAELTQETNHVTGKEVCISVLTCVYIPRTLYAFNLDSRLREKMQEFSFAFKLNNAGVESKSQLA
jgi:hypothetical protein